MRFAHPSFIPALLLTTLAWAAPASAWDGVVTGKIGGVEVTGAGNFDFRVYVGGLTSNACGQGTQSWVYVNQTDSNYQVYVSTITTAYFTGKSVSVYLTRAAGAYCRIDYMQVLG